MISQARILEWVPFLSPGTLPNPEIKPKSPELQVDSLPTEPPGKPHDVHLSLVTLHYPCLDLPYVLVVKNLPACAEDGGSNSGLGRSPGGGHGNPFQYS